MHPRPILTLLLISLLCPILSAAEKADIVIADFEGPDYGKWKASGEAFGNAPAKGTLPGQMRVSGFEGKGLVNTFRGGDGTSGKLVSPTFKIERPFINFLIGGGKHPGKTCLNLLVEGKTVRTATGPNAKPGGSEQLEWATWDINELQGKEARIEIVDTATGGWGHVNVDQIVQSNRRREAGPASRKIKIEKQFLLVPVHPDSPVRNVRFCVDGKPVGLYHIPLADREPLFFGLADVGSFAGKTLTVSVDRLPGDSKVLDMIRQGDDFPKTANLYQEQYRPQFHFTPRQGWNNDPNGMVYYKGEWHLFFQYNPFHVRWGNMTWGHAVSKDLIHWRELLPPMYPDALGTIYSGSAVIDKENTSGFQQGDEPPIVAIFTYAGNHSYLSGVPYTQGIAYSNDRGRTFKKYEGNPVVGHINGSNRDPKVIWHEPSKQWVMALYLGDRGKFRLLGSKNLKEWKTLCDVPFPNGHECPELFELPIEGKENETRWVFYEASGLYLIGTFDGKCFDAETEPLKSEWGKHLYASQTFNNVPKEDSRRILIGWVRQPRFYPGAPFSQQMSFPRQLTLRETPDGVRLCSQPIAEAKNLVKKETAIPAFSLQPGSNPLSGFSGRFWDLDMEIDPGDADSIELSIAGEPIVYDAKTKMLSSSGKQVPGLNANGNLAFRVLADWTTLEIFVDGGRTTMTNCFTPKETAKSLLLESKGGTATVKRLSVRRLQSIWQTSSNDPASK